MSHRIRMFVSGVIGCLVSSESFGGVLYSEINFDDPSWLGGQYVDTGDPSLDHDLINNPGQAFVDYPAVEKPFDAYYRNTRNDVGLTDGDFVGVTNFSAVVGSFTSGDQGYQMSDPDGVMGLSFAYVALGSYFDADVSIDIFIQDDSWELDDSVRVWLETSTRNGRGADVDLLNTTGSDIDSLGIEGRWMTLSYENLDHDFVEFRLRIELDSNAANEAIYIDTYRFYAAVAPTPGALALLGMAGVLGGRRRRSA